jgi:hypothetical protein
MATSFELSRTFPFTLHAIENEVRRINAPGVFVLDPPEPRVRVAGGFVGRSDTDIATTLERHVKTGFKTFAYCYVKSATEAYDRECEMWHEWKPTANPAHPTRPAGTKIPCAICGK